MEGMYAKIHAGNQYDIVFPIAKWVQKMRGEGKLRAIDHGQLTNADQVFYSGSYYNDPWYDEKSAVSVPFTVYKTGIGWRTDKVDSMTGSWNDLWNPQAAKRIFTLDDQDEALAMAALLLGLRREHRQAQAARRDQEAADQPEEVPPRLLLRRRQQHGPRRRLDPPHVERRLRLPAQGRGRASPRTTTSRRPRKAPRSTPTPTAIPTNAKHPGTAMVFIDYLLRPEIAKKNQAYLYYPFPVRDALPDVRGAGQGRPGRQRRRQATSRTPTCSACSSADEVQRRAAAWTEVKAS